MMRDEAVTLIQRRIGFRSDKADVIVKHMKDAQTRLEETQPLPWFLITEKASATTTAGEERCGLPSDFLAAYENEHLYYLDADGKWVALCKIDAQHGRLTYTEPGPPEAYALDDEYFRLFPTPDDSYGLRLVYYGQDQVLDSNIENKWLKHAPFSIIGLAGEAISQDLRDRRAMEFFQNLIVQDRLRLHGFQEAREHTNQRYVMGGED